MITGRQAKAARALLGWTAQEAGNAASITRKTVERFERFDGVPTTRSDTLARLQAAFEAAGIEFVGSPEEGPGVRLWEQPKPKRR